MRQVNQRYLQIGKRIKDERESMEWTQVRLSRESGVTQPNISEMESGKRAMHVFTAMKICDALGVSIDWLLRG